MKSVVLFFSLIILHQHGIGQQDTQKLTRKKRVSSLTLGTIGVGSWIGLNELWYKNYPRSPLHVFNDNSEWMGMDKCGHAFTTFNVAKLSQSYFQLIGYSTKKSNVLASALGFTYMTGIEILDGKSAQWGFSWGDCTANLLGSSLFLIQNHFFNQTNLELKFSYTSSSFAQYNPSQLGENFQQRLFKDYNGQKYWLTFKPLPFFSINNTFSNIAGLSFGYEITEMPYAKTNICLVNNFHPHREFLFSFDADLKCVKWKSKWMRSLSKWVSVIKIPLPTLSWSKSNGFLFHPIYF
jgi:uncharacterized protein YfiM (DUF2279 family)